MTEIELLRKENERLIAENTYLKKLLDNNGISYEYTPKQAEIVDTASEINRRIKLFMKLFAPELNFMPKNGRIKKVAAVTLRLAAIFGHLYAQRRKIKA